MGNPSPWSFRRGRANNRDQSRNPHCECWWPKGNHVTEAEGTDGVQARRPSEVGKERTGWVEPEKALISLLCELAKFLIILSLICTWK